MDKDDEGQLERLCRTLSSLFSYVNLTSNLYLVTENLADGVPQADGSIKAEPLMHLDHVASAVVSMANLPLEANLQNVTVMATKMPFVGRG